MLVEMSVLYREREADLFWEVRKRSESHLMKKMVEERKRKKG